MGGGEGTSLGHCVAEQGGGPQSEGQPGQPGQEGTRYGTNGDNPF